MRQDLKTDNLDLRCQVTSRSAVCLEASRPIRRSVLRQGEWICQGEWVSHLSGQMTRSLSVSRSIAQEQDEYHRSEP
jgi:hypothetical protein